MEIHHYFDNVDDAPQPWEVELGQRVGKLLTQEWGSVMWEVETRPKQILLRVANMSPWAEDEEAFTRAEEKSASKFCYCLNTAPLARASAQAFRQAIIRAGGLTLDAFHVNTETGQRIRHKVDVPHE